MTELVSVIIPAHGAAPHVAAAIASARAQGGERVEVVVVVDGRDDACAQAAVAAGADVVQVLPERRGAAAARNAGVAACRGELLCFLDADDALEPAALAILRRALTGDAVAAYGEASVDDGGAVRPHRALIAKRPTGDVLAALLRRNFLTTGAVLVRRAAFLASGGFPPQVPRAHDWVLWCRLAALGAFRYAGPTSLVRVSWRPSSISATLGTNPASMDAAIDVVFTDARIVGRFSAEERLEMETSQRAFACAVAGAECLKLGRPREARAHFRRAVTTSPSVRELLLWMATFSARATSAAVGRLR